MLKLYDPVKKGLIFVEERASSDFWNDHWRKSFKQINFPKQNRFLQKWMHKYFPNRIGLILEAGCGAGDKVYCMHNDGYKVVGIDFAQSALRRVKRKYPVLDLIAGDCFQLPFESGIFRACWSWGVIEHWWNGYDRIISEMKRVIEKDGYLLITFPSMSPIRRIKARFGFYQEYTGSSPGLINSFYQFALDEDGVIREFINSGFRLLEKRRYDGVKGLKDEINFLKPILQRMYDSSSQYIRINKFLLNILITPLTGHMSFLIFKKIQP